MEKREILRVEGLKTWFYSRHGVAKAVDGIDFSIGEGEHVGLVGESGSGKSVTALSSSAWCASRPAGSWTGGSSSKGRTFSP